jgi:hypothetical protein
MEPGADVDQDEAENAMRLVVRFFSLSGDQTADDFEIEGHDASRSIGCLFKHLKLSGFRGWRIVVGTSVLDEYARSSVLWQHASVNSRDGNSKHRLDVQVVKSDCGRE